MYSSEKDILKPLEKLRHTKSLFLTAYDIPIISFHIKEQILRGRLLWPLELLPRYTWIVSLIYEEEYECVNLLEVLDLVIKVAAG